MKSRYKVILAIEVDDQRFEYGDVAEFDQDTASVYAHALIAVEEGEE